MKKNSNQILKTLAFLFLSHYGMAQDVKVKKGEIILENKAVARIEKNDKAYQISDISNKPLFKAVITDETPLKNQASKKWLSLTGNNGVIRELDLSSKVGFTLNNEKYLVENLVLSNLVLFTEGLDEAKTNTFFQVEDKRISTQEDLVIETTKKIEKTEDSIAKINTITINSTGNVFSNGTKIATIIKKTTVEDKMFGNDLTYTILDINKQVVANLSFSNGLKGKKNKNKTIITFDNIEFGISVDQSSNDLSNDELAKRSVYKLYANGYHFGNMSGKMDSVALNKGKAQNNLIADVKSKSLNIYNTKGYVLASNGDKIEGDVTIEFESIDAKLNPHSNVSDITKYGSSVKLKTNGKDEFYKAKDGVRFCVGDRCFLGTKGSEDGALGNDSGSQLSVLGESQFFEIVHESNGNYVLSHVKHPNDYYLKLSTQDKAVYLGNKGSFSEKTSDKVKKIFDKYVNCTALDFSTFDTKTKEGLTAVIAAYQANCKK